MNSYTVDRFKEESFDVKGFLEEVYEECSRKGGNSCENIQDDLEKIKEALSYKEEELKSKKVYFSGKDKIESLSNALSSIELSSYSQEFIKISKKIDEFLKRDRFIDYSLSTEKNTLLDSIETPADLLEIAEFVEIAIQEEAGWTKKEKEESSLVNTVVNAFSSFSTGGESSAGEDTGADVSDKILNRLNRYKKKIINLAKRSYISAIDKNDLETAKKSAVLCYTLGLGAYPLEYLVKNLKVVEYVPTIITELDVLKENTLSDLIAYLERVEESAENSVYLIKDLAINNEYIEEKKKGVRAVNSVEIFALVKKLLSRMFSPVISTLERIEDPLEYLACVETILIRGSILTNRIYQIIPELKDKIRTYSVISISEDELFRKETESLHIVVDGLTKALSTGKSTLKYKLNGETLTSIKTPVESVFQYMAVCNKMSNRYNRLAYSSKILEELYKSQLLGFTLILDSIFSKKYVAYLGTNLHLSLYLCIKTFYTKITNENNTESIGKVFDRLNSVEPDRSKRIFSGELSFLIDKLEDLLSQYDSERTVQLLTSSFHHIMNTPIFTVIVKETLQIFYTKIKEKAFTRTSTEEVRSTIEYIQDITKYVKTLRVGSEKNLKTLKNLLEGVLVEETDVDRMLDLVKASHEERQTIKRIRERVKK